MPDQSRTICHPRSIVAHQTARETLISVPRQRADEIFPLARWTNRRNSLRMHADDSVQKSNSAIPTSIALSGLDYLVTQSPTWIASFDFTSFPAAVSERPWLQSSSGSSSSAVFLLIYPTNRRIYYREARCRRFSHAFTLVLKYTNNKSEHCIANCSKSGNFSI